MIGNVMNDPEMHWLSFYWRPSCIPILLLPFADQPNAKSKYRAKADLGNSDTYRGRDLEGLIQAQ